MKKLIAVLMAALAFNANAELWVTKNKSGGGIYVSSEPCHIKKYANLKSGYAVSGSGAVQRFCWMYHDGFVKAAYDDGTEYYYRADTFVKVSE